MKQLVILALQVSILTTVFGFGLRTTAADLMYLIRQPGLLARSLLAVFVLMPVFAVVLDRLFTFRNELEIVLVALAISPVPPILPMKEAKSGGHASYALGLMALLALISIVAVPVALEILQRVFQRRLTIDTRAVARVVATSTLVPLAAGVVVRMVLPGLAERLEKSVARLGKVLLTLAVLPLLIVALPRIWALSEGSTIIAIVLFVVVGLAIGHVLGEPDPDHSVVLALSTACRHPAIALTVAAANFPDLRFGAMILLYVLVSGVVTIPYVAWQRRQAAGAVRTA